MKLYTEEQVKEALKSGYLNFFDDTNRLNLFAQDYISKLTPIELPSDEEIESISKEQILYNDSKRSWWLQGAKWVIEQIKSK